MTVNASGEGRISGGSRGCQKLSRPINAALRRPFHSPLGFLEGQVGVPGVAAMPEAASAGLSIPPLRLPVRSRLGGRKSAWQHTCERMGGQRRRERAGDQETFQAARPRGDLRLMVALSAAGSVQRLCFGPFGLQA